VVRTCSGLHLLWWVWTCPNAVTLAVSAVQTGHSKSRSNSVRTSPDPRELPTGRRGLTHNFDSHPVITPEQPMSAFRGMLEGYELGEVELQKEPDRRL
jgi:hypothetical protein